MNTLCPKPLLCALLLVSFAFIPSTVIGQVVRVRPRQVRTQPQLVCLLCTLTVSASPASANFTLVQGGQSAQSTPIVVTTTASGVSALSSLRLYGYFTSASAALSDASSPANYIPSYAVLGEMPTGSATTFSPFSGSGPVGTSGAELQLYSTSSLLTLGCLPSTASCRTDNLFLKIDLTSLPQLPAGTYSGTLILQAQAL